MNRAIEWFAHHGVAANLLMAVMIVGGLFAAPQIPRKLFPDVDFGLVTVSVPYPGAAPAEVEQGVCVPIEEAIESVTSIDRIRTTAAEGACRIVIELVQDADSDIAATDIRNRVDGIQNFPEEAERPVVAKLDYKRSVVDLAISGDVGAEALKRVGERVRDEITALDEVTQADLIYARPYEISVEVPEENLRRYGLSFDQVVQAVRRSSLDLPGGTIKASGGDILLRSKGQAYQGGDFEDLVVVTRADGTRITLGQVATIVDGFEDTTLEARFDGQPAVMVRAYRVGDEDMIDVSDAVHAYVAEAQSRMPAGVTLTVWQDGSEILRGRLETLFQNGATGLVLVFLVLALFLRFRLAVWVALGVPIALLGAVMTLPTFGGSIDELTLFAFILVLGILVDDAIVVGENVYTHETRIGNRLKASIIGTKEVSVPVIFGVLTTVAAFFPLLVLPGRMGQLFYFMGATVICCLLYSVVESQLVLPSHLAHGSAGAAKRARFALQRRYVELQERFSSGLERFIDNRYRSFLVDALHWRYLAVAVGIAMLMLTFGVIGSGRVPFNFFPPIEADYVAGQLVMPQGTPEKLTREGVARLVASAEKVTEEVNATWARPGESLVRHRLVSIGRHAFVPQNRGNSVSGANVGEVVLELAPSEHRRVHTREIAHRWSELTGQIPGAKELTFASDFLSAGAPVDLQLRGPAGTDLAGAAAFVRQELASFPGVFDIADSFQAGKREMQLEILPEAEQLGLTMRDLARQVRQAFYGEEAQRIQRGRDDVRVMVRYPEAERRSLSNLDNLRIRSANGAEVPFWSVARAEYGRSYANIQRTDRERVVNVTADVDRSKITSNEVMAGLEEHVFPELKERYPGIRVNTEGEQEDQKKAFGGLVTAYPAALLAIFALLAVPLNSYVQPLIIMSVIPFGIVGAVLGHLLMRQPLSFASVVGMVALSGVVVNASLVLVAKVNSNREEGLSLREAVERAAAARFRPIVLTAVTTFAGLTPLLLEGSLQAQILRPMAISLAFGVVVATTITLVMVPCGYLILEDLLRFARRPRPTRPKAVRTDKDAHHEAA